MIFVVAVDLDSFFLSPLVQLAFQGYGPVRIFSDFYYCIVAVSEKEDPASMIYSPIIPFRFESHIGLNLSRLPKVHDTGCDPISM